MTELPGGAGHAGDRPAPGEQDTADAGSDVQVQRDGQPVQRAPARLGEPGEGGVVADQHGVEAGGQRRRHVYAAPVGQRRLNHPAVADRGRDRDPDAHHALAEARAVPGQRGGGLGEHAGACQAAARPLTERLAPARQLEGGNGKGVVPQVHRQHHRAVRVGRGHPCRAAARTVRRCGRRAG
jgi:hypothetical protein